MDSQQWLKRFHAGERDCMEECYRDCFQAVLLAVGRVLTGADQETVVHEVFMRMLEDDKFRASFKGGNLRGWLTVVARNRAIDFLRKHRREQGLDEKQTARLEEDPTSSITNPLRAAQESEAKALIARFRKDHLPEKWATVFEARFLRQLSQREAAAELGLHRTTLAYQEMKIRSILKKFLLRGQR